MKSKPRFVIRKVQNGTVRIFGKTFHCDEPCPQLEGKRFAFGLCWQPEMLDFVSLWGTEACYRAAVLGEENYKREYNSELMILTRDGIFRWEGWHVDGHAHCKKEKR